MSRDIGGARPKRRRLLTYQPVQIEGALEARRCSTHGADACQQQNERRRRNANKETDRAADAVKIAKSDACGIGRRHLPVGQLEPIGEMAEQTYLLMRQRHHCGADRLVVVGPEQIGSEAAAQHDHDQVEARRIVVRRPGGTGMGPGHRH